MKTPALVSWYLMTAMSSSLLGKTPKQNLSIQADVAAKNAPLNRLEWHSLSQAARQMEQLMHQTQPVRTRIWPHAVRDEAGRAGLIVVAQRPLLMFRPTDDLQKRQHWIVVAVVAAAKEAMESAIPLDHLALTDIDGANGNLWFYDVKMSVARNIYKQLNDRTITMDAAYDEIVSSWRLITAAHEVASQR
ncbi:MAG: hypothetical protein RL015_1299 [Verrucomicrobiota bacterium]|jgi:hypothetical protein